MSDSDVMVVETNKKRVGRSANAPASAENKVFIYNYTYSTVSIPRSRPK